MDLRFLVPVGLGVTGIALAVYQGGIGIAQVPPLFVMLLAFQSLFYLYENRKRPVPLVLEAAGRPVANAGQPALAPA